MSEEYNEYIIFNVTDRNGKQMEMAVIDEFEYDHKEYVAAALVQEDEILEDGVYIYGVEATEEFRARKIEDADEYAKVAEAYLNMER